MRYTWFKERPDHICSKHFFWIYLGRLLISAMLTPLENFYLNKEEPYRGCLMALRTVILKQDVNLTEEWKYKLPFFYYKGKMFCYLWIHKKYRQPYVGIVEGNRIDHPDLIMEKRARMKILLVDPEKDLPVKSIGQILSQALSLY